MGGQTDKFSRFKGGFIYIKWWILVHEFLSSNSSLTESLEQYKNYKKDFENYFKSLHCSDDFNFKFIDMNDFYFLF